MKALVTGGAGFIGSHTIELLLERGYRVKVLDNLTQPVHQNGEKPSYLPLDVEFILGDVRDKDTLSKALKDIDVVFHLAAYQDYLPDFSTFFHVNTVSTALIYELIVTQNLPVQKVIVASSQAVYGEGKYRCSRCSEDGQKIFYPSPRSCEQLERGEWDISCPICDDKMEPVLTAETKVNPHNQYAMSKYTQEMIALNLGKRYDIPTVSLRYSITQGSRQSFFNAYSGILRSFVIRLLNNEPPIVYEDGKQLRDYIWVGDVARANLLVLEDDRANFEVFNIGGGEKNSLTVLEYASLLINRLGKDIEPDISGRFRFGDTRHIISDISKIKRLEWKPTLSVEEIADAYISWVKTQGDLRDYYAEAEKLMEKMSVIRTCQ
ncbi:NAD-dependent epimerase/dehydratase family protein [Candidatus Aerophobetes bacterium]|nr:NAD-dependent epimerase/dehydratase family protein [Candidatus Aerophobetes bacterium]